MIDVDIDTGDGVTDTPNFTDEEAMAVTHKICLAMLERVTEARDLLEAGCYRACVHMSHQNAQDLRDGLDEATAAINAAVAEIAEDSAGAFAEDAAVRFVREAIAALPGRK